MKQEGRIDKKKKRASRKNKLLIAELEAAIRTNQFKRPAISSGVALMGESQSNFWHATEQSDQMGAKNNNTTGTHSSGAAGPLSLMN